jgi:hypothetical protein
MSNCHIPAAQAADAIRKHWGIENKQRHLPRRRFADPPRAPGIFARLRSFAYNILRSDTIAQDRYAAALGGIEALDQMKYFKTALNDPAAGG